MLLGDVAGLVGLRHDKFQLNLQGRVAEQAAELGLRLNLFRHEIQQENT